MNILITGASSGMGKDMAEILNTDDNKLFLVARNEKRLKEIQSSLSSNTEIIPMDISIPDNCFKLYENLKNKNIDVLINNAGYGIFGNFSETVLNDEMNLIDLNIKAVHILTKLFLNDFINRNNGFILNVSSSAGFMPGGPLMASYYASKSYILSLTMAIYAELKEINSKVYIGALCPGPVNTEFNKRAGVNFSIKGLESKFVADYAIKKMFKNRKLIIIPGVFIKFSYTASKLLPSKLMLKICYHIQNGKLK